MTRAFSLPSSGLAYFIGFILVHSDHVAICSPWLSDVELRFPVTGVLEERRMSLSAAIRALDTEVDIYIRSGESHNEYVYSQIGEHARITEVEDLHAKAVVGPEFVYLGSANITHGGLMVNIELCEIIENDYRDVHEYLIKELDLTPT